MKFINKVDTHIHSHNSPDSVELMENIAQKALNLGLIAIAVTDHCECQDYISRSFNKSTSNSILETTEIKNKYANKIYIARGVELGQPHYDKAVAEEVIGTLSPDYVLTSLHRSRIYDSYYSMDYKKAKHSPDYILTHYLTEMVEMIETNYLDCLAHMTYPLRYMSAMGINIDLENHQSDIDAVLNALISRSKALEINVNCRGRRFKESCPSSYIVKRFKELGGQYVTVGSDAHMAKDIGVNIEQGIQIALDCGFEHITIYKERVPEMIPIKNLEG